MKIPENFCPNCKNLLDTVEGIRSQDCVCEPGDFSVCACCGQILRFDSKLKPNCAFEADLKEIQKADFGAFMELLNAQAAVNEYFYYLN